MAAHRPPPPLKFRPPTPLKVEEPEEPEVEVVHGPPPSPNPEFHSDHQWSTPARRPVDLQAAIIAAKGKEKEFGAVSFFLVPHSSAYPKAYILIDIF
jgi:hypothetical protein